MGRIMPKEWDAVREQLKNTLKPGEFVNWIRPLRAVIGMDRVDLLCPNQEHKKYIEENFYRIIGDAFLALPGGKKFKVHLSVISTEEREKTPKLTEQEKTREILSYATNFGGSDRTDNANIDVPLTELKKDRPRQLSLFELGDQKELKSYSQAITFWDSIPKHVYSKFKKARVDSLPGVSWSAEILPSLEREFFVRGERFFLNIIPARLQKRDKSGKIILEYEVYPGRKEELIEDALRKMACTPGRAQLLNQRAGIVFTVYELQQELARMGHKMSHQQLKEGLLVCRKATLDVVADSRDGKALLVESIFSGYGDTDFDDWKKLKKSAKCYVKFSTLVSGAIMNSHYRLLNYEACMSYRSDFARKIHKRLALYFTQASKNNTYGVKLTSLVRDSGFTIGKRPGQFHADVAIPAFAEMKEKGVLNHYEISEIVYDPKRKNKIIDYRYELFPSKAFIKDQIRASSFLLEVERKK